MDTSKYTIQGIKNIQGMNIQGINIQGYWPVVANVLN